MVWLLRDGGDGGRLWNNGRLCNEKEADLKVHWVASCVWFQ